MTCLQHSCKHERTRNDSLVSRGGFTRQTMFMSETGNTVTRQITTSLTRRRFMTLTRHQKTRKGFWQIAKCSTLSQLTTVGVFGVITGTMLPRDAVSVMECSFATLSVNRKHGQCTNNIVGGIYSQSAPSAVTPSRTTLRATDVR